MPNPRRRAAAYLSAGIVLACGGVDRGGTGVVRSEDASTRGGAGGASSAGGSSGSASGGAPSCAKVQCIGPACHSDQEPVTLPGECCASLCRPRNGGAGGVAADGGTTSGTGGINIARDASVPVLACTTGPAPECGGNGPPYCAPDWQTALTYYPTCPNPQTWPPYLARCGDVNAIVVPGPYSSHTFYFGQTGPLIGYKSETAGETRCIAYTGFRFSAPMVPCVPLEPACADAATTPPPDDLRGIDAGAFIDWDGGAPSCAVGQAAYDAYLASQLAQFNTCTSDIQCGGFIMAGPNNACAQPCDLMLTVGAINSQIISRLDRFGNVACALCDPPAACPPQSPFEKCVNGTCVAGP